MRRRWFGRGDPAAGRSDNDALSDTGPTSAWVGVGQSRSMGAGPAPPSAGPSPDVFDPGLVRDVEAVLRAAIGMDDGESDLDVGLDILTQSAGGPLPAGEEERVTDRERATVVRHARRLGDRFRRAGRERRRARAVEPREAPPQSRLAGAQMASGRRAAWEKRYLRALLVGDFSVGVAVAAGVVGLHSGVPATLPERLHLLLPVALVGALGLAGAYESRFLFVGVEECRRVIGAGLSLLAAAAIVSSTTQVPLARAELLVALPAATLVTAAVRLVLRHRLRNTIGPLPPGQGQIEVV